MITASTPHPTTRQEAWLAWEAARLAEMQAELPARKVTAYNKRYWKAVDNRHIWLLAIEYYPNRGTVLVEDLDGNKVEIPVVLYGVTGYWKMYRVITAFLPERERQAELLAKGKIVNLHEILDTGSPMKFPVPTSIRATKGFYDNWYCPGIYGGNGQLSIDVFLDVDKTDLSCSTQIQGYAVKLPDGRTVFATERSALKKYAQENGFTSYSKLT